MVLESMWGKCMGNISIEMVQKLRSVGFSFEECEHFLNLGSMFYFDGCEYCIGGNALAEFTDRDKEIASTGIWLPTDEDLLEWLKLVGFDVYIALKADTRLFDVKAIDQENQRQYRAGHSDLSIALAKLIYKICKSGTRPYIPEHINRLKIDSIERL